MLLNLVNILNIVFYLNLIIYLCKNNHCFPNHSLPNINQNGNN